jgi:hypothetical protein
MRHRKWSVFVIRQAKDAFPSQCKRGRMKYVISEMEQVGIVSCRREEMNRENDVEEIVLARAFSASRETEIVRMKIMDSSVQDARTIMDKTNARRLARYQMHLASRIVDMQ